MSGVKPLSSEEYQKLKEDLKRCPEGTAEALYRYRNEGDLQSLQTFLVGIIQRHVEPEYESLLEAPSDDLQLVDDLGIDSMTMMEIVVMVEECLGIRIQNEELVNIRTYGDIQSFIASKLG